MGILLGILRRRRWDTLGGLAVIVLAFLVDVFAPPSRWRVWIVLGGMAVGTIVVLLSGVVRGLRDARSQQIDRIVRGCSMDNKPTEENPR